MLRALTLIIGCAALAACASTPPAEPIPAPVMVTPSRLLKVSAVRVERRGGDVIVSGRVARRTMMRGAVWGHLHVEAVSRGAVVAWADTRWTQLSKRRLPTSSFSVRLPATDAPIDEIHVSHVQQGHGGPRRSGS